MLEFDGVLPGADGVLVDVATNVGCVCVVLLTVLVAIPETDTELETSSFPDVAVEIYCSTVIGLLLLSPTTVLLMRVLKVISLEPLGYLVVLSIPLLSSLLYIATSLTQKAPESIWSPPQSLKTDHGGKCTLFTSSPGGTVHSYSPDDSGTFAIVSESALTPEV